MGFPREQASSESLPGVAKRLTTSSEGFRHPSTGTVHRKREFLLSPRENMQNPAWRGLKFKERPGPDVRLTQKTPVPWEPMDAGL